MECDAFYAEKASHSISYMLKLFPLKISLAFFDKGLHAFAHVFG
jgi:hypothetical protein